VLGGEGTFTGSGRATENQEGSAGHGDLERGNVTSSLHCDAFSPLV
jgi:hypothetical protein